MEAVELAVEAKLLDENSYDGYSIRVTTPRVDFRVQSLLLQAGYHVNCVPDGSWVHCGEALKATWSGESSDKCAAVIYVYYNTGIRKCTLNQTMRLIILQNIQQCSFQG